MRRPRLEIVTTKGYSTVTFDGVAVFRWVEGAAEMRGLIDSLYTSEQITAEERMKLQTEVDCTMGGVK